MIPAQRYRRKRPAGVTGTSVIIMISAAVEVYRAAPRVALSLSGIVNPGTVAIWGRCIPRYRSDDVTTGLFSNLAGTVKTLDWGESG